MPPDDSQALNTRYDPTPVEKKWYRKWEKQKCFHSEPDPAQKPFTIVIPPPNVTGALHMGHALNSTLQDVLIRWRHMQGYNSMWLPGSDHAGIATQAVVERRLLDEEGKTRHDLGREKLVERIWAWKDDYQARILNQLKAMGCACDWDRLRFTLDDVCARAVRHTFFRMFKDGLIYRGKRLVNWDTQLQTAVSDDEIFHETVRGHLWYFRYPVKGSDQASRSAGADHVIIATTRPETMLGDTAVAVHPEDDRWKHLIGGTVILPLLQREIPIIGDPVLVDPAFGTGCVKVTPAHDPNDYDCGLRHDLCMINILNPDGTINENGGPYAGLDRETARKKVVEDLDARGLIEKVEDYETEIGHSDRSKTAIEPYLSDQWFIAMADLAQAAMDAVQDGRVKIHPARYARTYLDWLGEKRDWCISRQLWWGHRIPIWYAEDAEEKHLEKAFGQREDVAWRRGPGGRGWLVCSRDEDLDPATLGPGLALRQEPDVLDTWFSSALWPHSTLGWPEPTPEMACYYPTSVLITSRDIITLWVARMVLSSLYNCGTIPFHDVYIHPKILDGEGQTMSKSKGNGVDPLDVIERYGADALRFTLAHLTTETQDFRMPVVYACPHCDHFIPQKPDHPFTRWMTCPACQKKFQPSGPNFDPDPGAPVGKLISERFERGRNFCNKLWNAARFTLMSLAPPHTGPDQDVPPHPSPLPEGEGHESARVSEMPARVETFLEDRWILSRLNTTVRTCTQALERYQYNEASQALYEFTWNDFCDWYLELAKPRLRADDRTAAPVRQLLAHLLDQVLRLLHPFIPFITEEIWQELKQAAPRAGVPVMSDKEEADVLMAARWPDFRDDRHDAAAERDMALVQDLVHGVRNIRGNMNVEKRKPVEALLSARNEETAALLRRHQRILCDVANVEKVTIGIGLDKPPASATHVAADADLYVPLADLIDLDAERKRINTRIERAEKQLQACLQKLENENFVTRAPAEIVERERVRKEDLEGQLQRLRASLGDLG